MRLSRLLLSAMAALGPHATAFAATPTTAVTVYRGDDETLYAGDGGGPLRSGYAVVRETRRLALASGAQTQVVDDLPAFVDAEALIFDPGAKATVLSRRMLAFGRSSAATLAGLIGHNANVVGEGGQLIASGTVLRADETGLLVRGDDGTDQVVRHYAALRTHTTLATGARLELRLDAAQAGVVDAVMSYPTAGLGWRASYTAVLQPGDACRLRLDAQAGIANRSGRDWRAVKLTLIAGAPRIDENGGPRPMLKSTMAAPASAAMDALPRQAPLDDYRSYTLPAPVTLADGSLTQVPLYAPHTLACERTTLYEIGNTWSPPRPVIAADFGATGSGTVTGRLAFTAFDSLPAGKLRVLADDAEGTPQFIGEGRVDDTPKGARVDLPLGTVFDLRAQHERTAFELDRSSRSLDEGFRVTLHHAGATPRMVTVRVHPDRWRQWTLASASLKPARQTPDLLEFRLAVPAGGATTLDYAIRYTWPAELQPQ
ncbi:DUF4139 domain-containing protein [Aerosticca soli]|uniref:DUF4139 domain-containing protein n=1 Tax=Aerosticca soli TaxID=2010829 RepID=A0A2Z6E655_9GAMM|nr:DUF4139 domain-containing protein [Aerosticca soli]BBD79959.1 hypothetical protein ALSL_1301 [Aerosticca soli]